MTGQLIISASDAQKWVNNILSDICMLENTIVDSALSDIWLDQQFVVAKGNLTDLSNMFGALIEEECKN
ncbi:MAG: hypothetical protein Q4F31_10545 [Eubacteriales bacterium]|nr:hypothetical protein [Eubacteriales bacterium]